MQISDRQSFNTPGSAKKANWPEVIFPAFLAVIIISQLIAAFLIKHMLIVRVEGDKAGISDSLARESHFVNKRQMVKKNLKTRKTSSHTAVELKTGEKLT